MKFGFVTCVQLGVACMEEIYRVGGRLDVIITLHDHLARGKSGRIYVDDLAAKFDIDVVKVRHINDAEAVEAIRVRRIDWLFIIGWSQIAGREVLAAPTRGCLGIHPSLLPIGRGRAAVPWAILKGLHETGVTLFKLDDGVDTGPVISQVVLPLSDAETATVLYRRVREAHATLIGRAWPTLVSDTVVLTEQDESLATVWPGRKPEDGVILTEMTCETVDRLVRAVTRPYPGAFIDFDGQRYTIWAGRIHRDRTLSRPFIVADGRVWLSLDDGSYEATDWEARPLT